VKTNTLILVGIGAYVLLNQMKAQAAPAPAPTPAPAQASDPWYVELIKGVSGTIQSGFQNNWGAS